MSIIVKRMLEMDRSRLYASIFPSASSRDHAAHITDMMRRAGEAINGATCAAASRRPPVEIIERDYGRDGRAWMVDPPGGLHDSAAVALAWARRYHRGANIAWTPVTAAGRAEVAAARARLRSLRG